MTSKQIPSTPTNKFNGMNVQSTYDLRHRFKNLQNPLGFIQNNKIVELQNDYKNLKSNMKQNQEDIAEFSKSIYKKVIARDNQYKFKHNIYGNEDEFSVMFNHKYSKSGQTQKIQERVKKEDLERKFKHGQITSLQEKRERMREQKQIPLTFQHIKMIDTPKFDEQKDVEFYSLIKGEADEKSLDRGSSEFGMSVINYIQNFKHKLIEDSQYHSKHSYNFLFNCDRQLKFWKILINFKQDVKSSEEVLVKCAFLDTLSVSIFDLFDFASHNIQIDDVIQFYKLKKELLAKMATDKNDQSLEEKYNQAKRRFQEMKENKLKSKNQKIAPKYVYGVAQTNDEMKQKDFDQYFVQDAKNIFDRLKQLNQIRDKIINMQRGETFNVMATNIGIEIGKQLFKLLLLVLKGQDFSDYSQFVRAENEQEVERKILQLIYLQFNNFKQYDVNGIAKVDIIKKYLEERQKNQRFYQTYLFRKTEIEPHVRK